METRRPGHLYISLENDEPSSQTLKHIQHQADLVSEVIGVHVQVIPVPCGYKDLAEYNQALKAPATDA